MKKITASALVFLCFFCAAFSFSAEPVSVTPKEQPLAVVRADSAALFRSIARTRQARAFGWDGEDFHGGIPGMDATLRSLREFLAALGEAGAESFWYCLLQDGGTLADRTAAFGWDESEDVSLADAGVDLRGAVVDTRALSSGGARITVGGDAETLSALVGGANARPEPWRDSLSAFLARRDGMAGGLVNSRPLFGILSLATLIDFRSQFTRFGLNIPDSVQLELFDNGGDLGFEARLNNLVPEAKRAVRAERSGRQTVLSFKKDPLFELNVSAPEQFFRFLPFEPSILALANLDASVLVPESVNLTVWRADDGRPAWASVCLVPDREAFRKQLRRVDAWLEALEAAGAAPARTGEDRERGVFRLSGREFVTSLVPGEGAAGYFLVAASPGDFPDPRTIRKQTAGSVRLAQYRSALDGAGRKEFAKALSSLEGRHGLAMAAIKWEAALPEKDSGYLSLDGGSLVLMSRNGLLPFLVPALAVSPR